MRAHVPSRGVEQGGHPGAERRLVARLVAGDDSALARIYDQYAPLVFGVAVNLVGDDGSLLTRRQGEALASLQHVVAAVFRQDGDERRRIVVDCQGYRRSKDAELKQMATFLAEHYDGDAVMVNDLGYVAWLHDGPEVDMAGLGTFEVLDATKNGNADPAFFAALAERRDVAVVAIYADLFGGFVPDQWTAVETWCLQDELVTAADDCVTFYATDTKYLPRLIDALDTFDERLPPSVVRLRQIAP